MTRISHLLCGAALGLMALPAAAELEDGLYGAAVPSDAVFVRQIGGLDAAPTLFGRTFTVDELPEATYVAISASALDGAEPGAHYTVLAEAGGLTVIEEPARPNPSKVYLFLLNEAGPAAQLNVAGGGATVIDPTRAGAIGSRAVNPLAVTLSVQAGAMVEEFDVILRRGVNITFVVADGRVQLIENQFGPVIEAD